MWDMYVLPLPSAGSDQDIETDLSAAAREYTANHAATPLRYKKVMLAYDGSPFSKKALDVALTIVQEIGAKLLIVGVVPLPKRASVSALQETVNRAHKLLSRKFYKIRLDGMNEGLKIETMIALGDAPELTRYNAERFRSHLIILGYLECRSRETNEESQ
jgi:hypothetical protein